ncbi:hypothetical protein GLV94_02930 [Virgibacillus halodenitrificans]|uniref:hypothetical protein n=1 Tax=Virgibacillus halodenitrificans TaxID=1482 RepID=UPI001367E8C5|nr:hypothetical protein [Virgibacillus halodenitrificans]MYL44587.1 hypothetical protein [Virgibacillus halodenitrificans]
MAGEKAIVFGLADITIGDGVDALTFNGTDYLQAEGGELSLTPQFQDITVEDFGEVPIEKRLSGWEGQLKVVAAEEDAKILELALGATEDITDSVSSEVVGSMDAKIGTKLKGQKVVIHPRSLPASDKSRDITIYQMASTEGLTRSYANEQGNVEITLTLLPRQGFDASKPGNFFYRGGTDPNAA